MVAVVGALVVMACGWRREAAAAGILWAALCFEVRSQGRIARLAQHLGDTSYSTCLCPSIVITAVFAAVGVPTAVWSEWLAIAAITLLVLACSELSYRLVERRRPSPRGAGAIAAPRDAPSSARL
jgi:peptidoglycan/LPS O-acetylase OafA/YrhL